MPGRMDMICSLDYLIGTLATAYKGVLTTLVAKDFCICEADGISLFKGAILSMPAGDYSVSLIKAGEELARSPIASGGSFELAAESALTSEAPDLQIDILQNGRHIGTFLLKRGKGGAFPFYTPAFELSEEIKGVDFNLLTRPLEGRPGLLRKAEDIVYTALSAKKDWRKFSDELHGLANDLFWQQREVFYGSFGLFVKFALLAAQKSEAGIKTERPLANFLDLMEQPLSMESDAGRLEKAVDAWLSALKGSRAELSLRLSQSARVLSAINVKFPQAEIGPAVRALFASLLERIKKAPALSAEALGEIKGFVSPDDFRGIERYGEEAKKRLLAEMEEAGRPIVAAAKTAKGVQPEIYAGFFRQMERPGLALPDEMGMVEGFFGAVSKNFSGESAPAFTRVLFEVLSRLKENLSGRAGGALITGVVGFAERLMAAGRPDLCVELLSKVAGEGIELQKEVVLNAAMASRILASRDELLAFYKGVLKQIIIPPPGIRGYSTETWAENANPLHLELISRFLEVLGAGGPELDDVKAHVICNLFLSGVFIPDDRLFQRKVSAYLNSPAMKGNFLLNYMLLKRLPVYFNEVGATDMIRDYTTRIDSWGDDPVLYFLRKQVHVNASNYNIRLAEGIMRAWAANEPALLEALVPQEVFKGLDKKLLEGYHRVMRPLFEAFNLNLFDEKGDIRFEEKLLDVPEDRMKEEIEKIPGGEEARQKVLFLCRIYQEIVKKYALFGGAAVPRTGSGLRELLDSMESAKVKFLSPEKTEPRESLYFKRHIAFGIPSVLGTYHEEKFDAFSEFLRLGERARVAFEGIISGIEAGSEGEKTAEKISEWVEAPGLANRLLTAGGIANFQADEFSVVLASLDGLRPGQILDVLRMWQKEIRWAVESFNRIFLHPLGEVLKATHPLSLPGGADFERPLHGGDDFAVKAADIVIRDMMTSIPGFTEADRLINVVADRISARIERDKIEGKGEADIVPAGPRPSPGEETADFLMLDELTDAQAMRLAPIIGGKAKNLVYLNNKGFLVPPGAVFSSGHTWDYEEYTKSGGFRSALRSAVGKIEQKTGKVFGGDNPLFLSVRSGSYISMPGILVSILYCGMNGETIRGFTKHTGNALLAWDSYRRFLEHFGTSALGLEQRLFEGIKGDFIKKYKAGSLGQLDARRMEELAGLYLGALSGMGFQIPDDVYEQLGLSVRAVYASWFGGKAVQFARITGMSPKWGTAVTLMRMVSGNAPGAGASVFFTRDPATLEEEVYGETKQGATGDELVYGAGMAMPVSKRARIEGQLSLEENDPELFRMHNELARRIEGALGGLPQEVEATYTREDGGRKIYVLQTRRMEFDARFIERFEEICRMESRVIGRGIGVHGGALSGVASFSDSPEAIRALREQTGLPVILLRQTASTADVSLMTEVGGIIAAAGGATSHASILAQKFNLTAIAGCGDLRIGPGQPDREGGRFCARIGNAVIREGEPISMDGQTGLIFSGICLDVTKTRH
ncbi:MAG: PEP-utilizing enzyme [Nitrospiraceae bacterium]|nr:PEP-utilizing enzyme [Nitrospiraceae bacterium]